MTQAFQTMFLEDNGRGIAEYAVIMALIALVTIGTVSILGITIRTLFEVPIPVLE